MKNPENENLNELDAETRAIVRAAAELPILKPSRDLWSGIAARIEAPIVALPLRSEAAPHPSPITAPHRSPFALGRLALAASLLVASSVGITYTLMKQTTVELAASSDSSSSSSVDLPSTNVVPVSLQSAEQTFDREIGAMRKIVDERRKELDPATVLVLEKNLKLIDAAISESKAALAKDPASAFLLDRLSHAYDTKLQLLRGVASIPTRG